MNKMPFAYQKTDSITFCAEETTFAYFGGGLGRVLHQLSFGLWFKSVGPNTHPWGENGQQNTGLVCIGIARFSCDSVSLVSFWSGVKSRGTHLAETIDIGIRQ